MYIQELVYYTPIASFFACTFIYFFCMWYLKKYEPYFARLSHEMQAMTLIR